MSKTKIGVIGDKDSILGFKTLGLDIFPVTGTDETSRLINRLAKEDYAILFVTEAAAQDLEETINRYKAELYPTIILIPGNQGSLDLGMQEVKKNVEKAIGTDILFGERG